MTNALFPSEMNDVKRETGRPCMVFSLCVSVVSGTKSESSSDSDLLAVHTGMDHACVKVKVRFAVEKEKINHEGGKSTWRH